MSCNKAPESDADDDEGSEQDTSDDVTPPVRPTQ